MSFNEHPQQILARNQARNGGNAASNIGDEIKENDFPILKKLISELASNLDKHSQYLKKEKDQIIFKEEPENFIDIYFNNNGELSSRRSVTVELMKSLAKYYKEGVNQILQSSRFSY